jgi:hypothetical protein
MGNSLAGGKPLPVAIKLKAVPPPTSGGKTLARSACASMANGLFFVRGKYIMKLFGGQLVLYQNLRKEFIRENTNNTE